MPRTPQRQAALQLCLFTFALAVCAFLAIALLTYDVADRPGQAVWPPPAQTSNWCGQAGAWTAHHLNYWLGAGSLALVGVLLCALAALGRGLQIADPWLRLVGVLLLVTVVSTGAAVLAPGGEGYPAPGAGGVVGAACAAFFTAKLQTLFTLMLLGCGLIVSLLLAADELFFGVSRGLGEVGRRSAPVLIRGGAALASAGSAMAAGVANLSGKLATATAGGGGTDTRRARAMMLQPEPRPKGRSGVSARPAEDDEPADEPGDEVIDEAEAVETEIEAAPRRVAAQGALTPSAGASCTGTNGVGSHAAGQRPGHGAHTNGHAPSAAPAERRGPMADEEDSDEESSTGAPAGGPVVKELGRSEPVKRSAPPRLAPQSRDDQYVLPPLTMLGDVDPIDKGSIELLCREKAYILEQTLNEFRLEVQVVSIETGPVITVFELRLAAGIKVSQIASLTNDMARALKAPAVRVVAPLPGKNTIGIEVPNLDKEKVRLKDLVMSMAERLDQHAIPLFLGKDASGASLVSDLSRMPHLLIAGTTGSGKSVCVGSIIMSILLTRTPSEVQLILVDPKVVELAMFKDIPHLMCPIITEMSKAEGILDWAATKMDERYALLAEAGVKDIRSYNRLGEAGLRERMQITDEDEMKAIPIKLPYIVIVIDELADLMMTSAKEVEFYLCRLAQKSRAVGIHLIVSTQRPQANVVTGLIKSNLPCRIAFRVASRLDSRIVLDQNGGEVLMGQGDMLFLPPGSSKLVRAQGTFVGDDELRDVVRHCRGQGEPQYHPELMRMPKAGSDAEGERDELFDEAVDIIIESGRGSVSLLQRRLTIGYGRASRLVDQMYAAGIVGDYKGSQAREVIVSKEEWQAIRAQRDREMAEETDES